MYGLPAGSTRNNNDDWEGTRSGDSTPSLSPLNSDDLDLDADDSFSTLSSVDDSCPSPKYPTCPPKPKTKSPQTYAHRKEFEDLQAKQYWRSEWRSDADAGKGFDIGDASTLGVYTIWHPSLPDDSNSHG